MIKLMEKECTYILTERNMKDNGNMICNMVKEKSLGQMEVYLKVTMLMGRKMVEVNINGLMEHLMMVSGKKMR